MSSHAKPSTLPDSPQGSTDDNHASDAEEMAKYGILRVTVNYYHYGDFRYTSLKDAVAQAKRAG